MEDKTSSLPAEYISLRLLNRPTTEPSAGHIDLFHTARELSFCLRPSCCSLNDSLIVGADLHHSRTVYPAANVSGAVRTEVLLDGRWVEEKILT